MLPGPYCTFYQQSHIQPHVHLQGRPSRDVYVAPRLGWGAAPGGLPCQGRSCAGVQPGQCLAQAWLRRYSAPVRGAMQLRHQDGLPPATGWPATGQQLSGPPCCASCCRQQHLLAFWEQHVAVCRTLHRSLLLSFCPAKPAWPTSLQFVYEMPFILLNAEWLMLLLPALTAPRRPSAQACQSTQMARSWSHMVALSVGRG